MKFLHVLRWLGLNRFADNFFALGYHRDAAERRALGLPCRPGKSRRRSSHRTTVDLPVERLETRWLMTTLQFSASTYSVNEAAGTATITVTADTAPSALVSVSYAASDGSGVAGTDYTATSAWLAGLAGNLPHNAGNLK